MSQDIISDALNQIMNSKKAGKDSLKIKRISKLLIKVLESMKKDNLIDFKMINNNEIGVDIKELSEAMAIKPRFNVKYEDIDKYARRFLPARGVGTLIISTSKGLMTNEEALNNKIGGSLIAFFY